MDSSIDDISYAFLDDRERKTQEHLEPLLLEGLESGAPITVTPEFWKDLWGRVDERKNARNNGVTI